MDALVNQIVHQEPLISAARKPQLARLIQKLIEKQESNEAKDFYLYKILRAHILPLTNCAFNKASGDTRRRAGRRGCASDNARAPSAHVAQAGDKFLTGSYDRTCKIWNTETGEEYKTLEGHKNVVYAIAFNNPYGDKIVTGSFDKTAKVCAAAAAAGGRAWRGCAATLTAARTRGGSCGAQKPANATTRSRVMVPRSCASRSIRRALRSRRAPWTTPRGCGMWKLALTCPRCW